MKTSKFPKTEDSPCQVYLSPDPPTGGGQGDGDGDDTGGVKE